MAAIRIAEQLIGLAVPPAGSVSLIGTITALDTVARIGSAVVLGILALALGMSLLATPAERLTRRTPTAGEDHGVSSELLLQIHSPEFRAMSQRVLEVTALTSRLNTLPFEDEAGRAALLERILGRPLPERLTVYPPFFTDHGLNLELGERVFINQNCTFLDYAGIRIADRVLIAPGATLITVGHPVDVEQRRVWLTGGPIEIEENVWIGAGATILPGVRIGRDAVIAAGAIVADDVPARSVVSGDKAAVRRRWE